MEMLQLTTQHWKNASVLVWIQLKHDLLDMTWLILEIVKSFQFQLYAGVMWGPNFPARKGGNAKISRNSEKERGIPFAQKIV